MGVFDTNVHHCEWFPGSWPMPIQPRDGFEKSSATSLQFSSENVATVAQSTQSNPVAVFESVIGRERV